MSDDAKRDDLPNGMAVLTRERPYADVTAISISVKGGSRNEHVDTVGAAHFMEHMFFQGTPSRPSIESVFGPISARGGWLNAYTSFENINFQAVVKNEDFQLALDTLADMLVNALFADDRIDKERQVVLEELIRGKNEPRRYAGELFFKHVFEGHPCHNLPIGSRETLNNSNRAVLMSFRNDNFLASNMYTAVVGDQQHEDVAARVAAAFKDMPTGPRPLFETAPIPAAKARRIEETTPGTQSHLVMGLPAPGANHEDTYPLDILSTTLGEVGRRLVTEVRDKRGLAPGIGSSYSSLSDVGAWLSSVSTSPENIEPIIELVVAEMKRIRSEPLSATELEDSKTYIEGRAVLGLQSSISFAQYLADREAIGVEPPLEEYLRRVSSVTAEDVQRVAQKYLDPDALTMVLLSPG